MSSSCQPGNDLLFQEVIKAACEIIDKIYDRVSAIARRYDLFIQTSKKIAKGDDWTIILEIKGDEPEYRVGFDVALLPKFTASGTAYVWSLVTDLKTGQWQQFIKENTPLDNLED